MHHLPLRFDAFFFFFPPLFLITCTWSWWGRESIKKTIRQTYSSIQRSGLQSKSKKKKIIIIFKAKNRAGSKTHGKKTLKQSPNPIWTIHLPLQWINRQLPSSSAIYNKNHKQNTVCFFFFFFYNPPKHAHTNKTKTKTRTGRDKTSTPKINYAKHWCQTD